MRFPSFLLVFILFASCNLKNEENKIVIFHAGSISNPLKEIADSFLQIYPNIKIYKESAGSVECIRKITELKKNCDILISSDNYLIKKLMFPNYTQWSKPFATNEIVLAFSPENNNLKAINSENWIDILLSKKVRFSRSDPNADPCGYRTLIVWKLAEKYYKKNGLYKNLVAKDLNYIRPKEIDMLALIQSNTVDYIFIYRSVAIQHKLNFISLPDNINLGNTNFENDYQKAEVVINGKKPGEKITIKGKAIVYGLTIPTTSKNKELAENFVKFIINDSKEILLRNGLILIDSSNFKSIPN